MNSSIRMRGYNINIPSYSDLIQREVPLGVVLRPRKPALGHGFGVPAGALSGKRPRGDPFLLQWNKADVGLGQRGFFPLRCFVLVVDRFLGAASGSYVPTRWCGCRRVLG